MSYTVLHIHFFFTILAIDVLVSYVSQNFASIQTVLRKVYKRTASAFHVRQLHERADAKHVRTRFHTACKCEFLVEIYSMIVNMQCPPLIAVPFPKGSHRANHVHSALLE